MTHGVAQKLYPFFFSFSFSFSFLVFLLTPEVALSSTVTLGPSAVGKLTSLSVFPPDSGLDSL